MESIYASSDKSDSSSHLDETGHLYENVTKFDKPKGMGLHSRLLPIFRRGALTGKQNKCASSVVVPGKKVSFISQNRNSDTGSPAQGYSPAKIVPVTIERRPLYENIRNNNASPIDVFLYNRNAVLHATRGKKKPIASVSGRRIDKPKLKTATSSITTSFTADWQRCSGSESGSEAEEIRRIFEQNNNEGKSGYT